MATLNEKQAKLLLDPNLAVVGTIRPDGTPHVTPTWVDWDGEHVLINTGEGRSKLKYLRRDPRVSVFVLDPNDPFNWVSITGTAELTHEGAEEHIHKLSRKYTGRDYDTPEHPKRILVKITPERVHSAGG
jgi:PPOX class probable F420-dependent enzyme